MLLSATTKIEPFQDLLKPNANRSRSAEDSFELSKQLGTLPASTLQQLPKKPNWGGLDKKQAWQLQKAATKARQIKNRGVKKRLGSGGKLGFSKEEQEEFGICIHSTFIKKKTLLRDGIVEQQAQLALRQGLKNFVRHLWTWLC